MYVRTNTPTNPPALRLATAIISEAEVREKRNEKEKKEVRVSVRIYVWLPSLGLGPAWPSQRLFTCCSTLLFCPFCVDRSWMSNGVWLLLLPLPFAPCIALPARLPGESNMKHAHASQLPSICYYFLFPTSTTDRIRHNDAYPLPILVNITY